MKDVVKSSAKLGTVEADTMLAILTTNSYRDAAAQLGISEDGLLLRRKQYGLDAKINALPQQALERLKIYSVRAADTFGRNLNNPRNQMTAAAEILDRVGVGKGPSVVIQNNQTVNEIEFFTEE